MPLPFPTTTAPVTSHATLVERLRIAAQMIVMALPAMSISTHFLSSILSNMLDLSNRVGDNGPQDAADII